MTQIHQSFLTAKRTEARRVALAYQVSPSTCHQTLTLQLHQTASCSSHLNPTSVSAVSSPWDAFSPLPGKLFTLKHCPDASPLLNFPWLPQAEFRWPLFCVPIAICIEFFLVYFFETFVLPTNLFISAISPLAKLPLYPHCPDFISCLDYYNSSVVGVPCVWLCFSNVPASPKSEGTLWTPIWPRHLLD